VPAADRCMNASDLVVNLRNLLSLFRGDRSGLPPRFPGVSRREIASLLFRLIHSQRPGHSPAHERTPPFTEEWIQAYDAGRDVVNWYDGNAAG